MSKNEETLPTITHETYEEWLNDTDGEKLFLMMLIEVRNPGLETEKAINLAMKNQINVKLVNEVLYWMRKKRDNNRKQKNVELYGTCAE